MARGTGTALLIAVVVVLSAAARAGEGLPVIEAIEGDRTVVVKTREGNRVAAVGTEVRYGDRVKTGAQATVKLRFPDGTKMLIGRYSEVTIVPQVEEAQVIALARGEVRAVVRPAAGQNPDRSRVRFLLRTKAAVMGVRGTDFVTEVVKDEGVSKLYTLDGSVQLARTEAEVLAGKGTAVGAGMSARADERAIEAPRPFERERYLENLAQAQPGFATLMKDDAAMVSQDRVTPLAGPAARRGSGLLGFQFSGVYAWQEAGGRFLTSQFSWAPVFHLNHWLALRGSFGALLFRNRSTSTAFLAAEGIALLGVRYGRVWLEGGGGLIGYLTSGGRTKGILGANLGYQLREEGLLDRLVLGIRQYDLNDPSSGGSLATRHLLAGIGIRL